MSIDHPLSPGGSTLAVLDANVLLPPRLSDILFDMFMIGLYYPRWTQTIEGEFIRNFGAVALAENAKERKAFKAARANPKHIAKAQYRLNCFRDAVGPEYEVLLYDRPAYRAKVPPAVHAGDIHVASAALVLHTLAQEEGVADKVFIVSSNLAHLAVKDLAAMGISVLSPGAFIDKMNTAAPARVKMALLKTINDLSAPPFTKEDLLSLLVMHGATETAGLHETGWKTS